MNTEKHTGSDTQTSTNWWRSQKREHNNAISLVEAVCRQAALRSFLTQKPENYRNLHAENTDYDLLCREQDSLAHYFLKLYFLNGMPIIAPTKTALDDITLH